MDNQPVESSTERFVSVVVDTTGGKLADLLLAEVGKATLKRLTPFVMFYAEWCMSCKALIRSMDDPRMVDALAGTYIIRLDLDALKGTLSGTGFDVKVIPVFYALDKAGKPTGITITGAAWAADIPENMARPLKNFFAPNKW